MDSVFLTLWIFCWRSLEGELNWQEVKGVLGAGVLSGGWIHHSPPEVALSFMQRQRKAPAARPRSPNPVCACVHARVLTQLCLTLHNLMDCSPPGSSVHGIFQARILERLAISFSRRSSWPRDWTYISCVSCIGRCILYQLSHRRMPYSIFPLTLLRQPCAALKKKNLFIVVK